MNSQTTILTIAIVLFCRGELLAQKGTQPAKELPTLRFEEKDEHRRGVPKPSSGPVPKGRSHTFGGKKMLAILPAIEGDTPQTIARIRNSGERVKFMYEQLDRYMLMSSYGKLWVDQVTVAPFVTITKAEAADEKNSWVAARERAAEAMGTTIKTVEQEFDFITVIFDKAQQVEGISRGQCPGQHARLTDYRQHILVHELAHNLGQGIHYDAWIPSQMDDRTIGAGSFLALGHPWGALGGFSGPNRNKLVEPLQAKQRFGWVTMGPKGADIVIVDRSTKLRLFQHDTLKPRGTLGAFIKRPGSPIGLVGNRFTDEERKQLDQYSHYLLSYVASKTAVTAEPDPRIGRSLGGNLERFIGRGLVVERVSVNEKKRILDATCVVDCTFEPSNSENERNTRRNAPKFLSNCFLPIDEPYRDRDAGIEFIATGIGTDKGQKYIDIEIQLTPQKDRQSRANRVTSK